MFEIDIPLDSTLKFGDTICRTIIYIINTNDNVARSSFTPVRGFSYANRLVIVTSNPR